MHCDAKMWPCTSWKCAISAYADLNTGTFHTNKKHFVLIFMFTVQKQKAVFFKSKYSEIRNWSNREASVVNRIVTRVCRYTPNYLWWWWNITPGFQKQGKWPCNILISFKFGRRNENVRQVAGERITHLLQNTGLCNLHTNQVPAFSLKRSLRLNKSTIFRTTQALMPRYCQ